MFGKLPLFLLLFAVTGCAVLKEQTFSVSGSEIAFSVPQQFESNTFQIEQESKQSTIEQNMKDRGLPLDMLTSVKLSSLTLRVQSDDPGFDIGSIEELTVTIALDGGPAIQVAGGAFSGFSGNEALLELKDTELLDLLSTESAIYTLRFTVDELPAAPVRVSMDPGFQLTTKIF